MRSVWFHEVLVVMKRSTDRGIFWAAARSARTGVIQSLPPFAHVEVDVELIAVEGSGAASALLGKRIKWRGGFSAAAIHRTIRSLLAMGATFPDDDPTALDGVGSVEFRARVVEVDCSEEESHGTAASRFFIREVMT